MTQRIFDIENEKDMTDLWDIVPDKCQKIKKSTESKYFDRLYRDNGDILVVCFLNINWHDKTEITRPIPEATEADIGKLCYFWDYDEQKESGTGSFGKLCIIDEHKVKGTKYQGQNIGWFPHCRKLTKQEIEELC